MSNTVQIHLRIPKGVNEWLEKKASEYPYTSRSSIGTKTREGTRQDVLLNLCRMKQLEESQKEKEQ